MKKIFLFSVGFVLLTVFLSAKSPFDFTPRAGDWSLKENRIYQSDESAGAMLAHIALPQQGIMTYEFNVRYEGGALEDYKGGFGIHIYVNNPTNKNNSWGDGDSVLLWLNYDANPYLAEIPAGLSAEVYHSSNNHVMDLAGAYSLNDFSYLLTDDVANLLIPIKLKVNGYTGQAWITSPVDPSMVYTFNIGKKNLKGNYISLRTNSLAVSFGM
jgi:hypothetical protein